MREILGIPLITSAAIHLAVLSSLLAVSWKKPEVPVIYVSHWVTGDIAGKNAGPAVTREAQSAALRGVVVASAKREPGKDATPVVRDNGGERVLDNASSSPPSHPATEMGATNGFSATGPSAAESGSHTNASLPVGKTDANAFTEHARKQLQAWRHQFMMDVEAQLHAVKARNYYKSVRGSLERALANSKTESLHNQSATVEIALQDDGAIREILVDGEADNELTEVLVETVDWAVLPLPSRFDLPDRGLKLTVTVATTGKICVSPELLSSPP